MITPPGFEQDLHAGDEVVEVGHVGEHVVAEQQVGCATPPRSEPCAVCRPKNSTSVGIPFCSATLRDVGGGLDAEHGDPALVEVLQQVAVVGGELDHVAVGPELEALDHLLDVAAGVLEPGRRVRREVRVVGEDPLGRLELLELHEQAALADVGAQRVEGLHRVLALRRHEAVRQRRHAEVGEHVLRGA